MEIGLVYSKDNSDHRRTAMFVKRAAKNLGLSAKITEHDQVTQSPQLVVNGFDMSGLLEKQSKGSGKKITYDSIVRALEQTAWLGLL